MYTFFIKNKIKKIDMDRYQAFIIKHPIFVIPVSFFYPNKAPINSDYFASNLNIYAW